MFLILVILLICMVALIASLLAMQEQWRALHLSWYRAFAGVVVGFGAVTIAVAAILLVHAVGRVV